MEFDRTAMLPDSFITIVSTPLRSMAWQQAITKWNEERPEQPVLQWRVNERDHFDYFYLVNAAHLNSEQLMELAWEACLVYTNLKAEQHG